MRGFFPTLFLFLLCTALLPAGLYAQERNASNSNSGANEHSQIARETHVTPAQALNVGYTFMRTGNNTRGNSVSKQTMQLIYTGRAMDSITLATTDCYYVFSLQPKGFVIVAADDRVEPILGYSYDNDFVVENMPDHVRGWLGNYEKQIEAVVKQNLTPEAETATKWSRLKAGQSMSTRSGESVGPLLTTQWGQGWPYNAMCPIDSLAGEAYHYRCPTGCVATAFAQIMNYWKYPEKGRGEYGGIWYNENTYQWDIMDINHIDEISKLMYHIGVGANMVYGPTASSANIEAGRLSLVEWFEYENAEEQNRSDFSDDTWTMLLDSLLSDSIPVVYGGFSSEDYWSTVGHAWVCDGYDVNGLYHMNWGWDGGLDGYFDVHSLLNGFSSFQTINYVRPGQPPLLSRFRYEPNQLNPTILQFVDQSYNFPETNYWDFGDGSTSTQINPIHEYTDPGEYLVTHTVCKGGVCDSEQVGISVFSYSFLWNGDTLSPHDGESRPLVIDYDMDGKQDFLISSSPYEMLVGGPNGWRDYISNPTTLYRNVDSTFIAMQLQHESSLPPFVIDVNNENKPSVLLDGLYLHNVNEMLIADSILTLQSAMNHGERFSVVDYNNDGRMDVMIGDTLYKNIGGGLFKPALNIPFGRTWVDYDKDGDMDLFTNQGIKSSVYRNNGDGTFSRQTVEGNYHYTAQSIDSTSGTWFDVSDYGDIDGDGWMDFIDGGRTVWNRGNNHFETDVYGGEICSDYTLEGTIDRICASGAGFKLYEDGEFTFNRTLYPNFGIYANTPASLAFIDRDGDNRPDLLATGFCEYEGFYGNSTIVYDNNSSFENLPPSPPTGLSSSVTGNNVVLSWQPSTDDHNSVAITYNIAVGTSPDSCDVYSPLSNLETGKRYAYNKGNAGNVTFWKVNDLPNGTYYWRVQAIDNAMAASPFSTVNTFVVNNGNLPPAMANMTKKGYVGRSTTFEKENFTNNFFDPEHDTLHSIKICALPENGTLQLSGVPVEVDQIIPASSLDELTYKSGQPGLCTIDIQPYDGYNFSIDTAHICINTVIFEQTNVLLADNISALAWGDFDNDGDADLASNTGIWRNDSGTFTQIFISPVAASSVQWVDANRDGLLDCLFDMTICINQGFGVFSAQPSLETSTNMKTAIMDLNSDNHPDIAITRNNMSSAVFFNAANGYNADSIQPLWNNSTIGSIAVGDCDRDGDEDVIMVEDGTWNVQFFNNQNGVLVDNATQIANYSCGSSDWGDYDNDGDLDFIGTTDNTGVKIYNNDGSGSFLEVFTGVFPIIYNGFVKWYDYDNDGYLDLLMSGFNADDNPTTCIYKNIQGGGFVKVDNINLPVFINPHCAISDYDHDGFGDLAISGIDGSGVARISLYRNCMGNTVDSSQQTLAVPQNLTSTVVGSSVQLNWNDTTLGCSYNVYIRKNNDSNYVVSPLADIQTGARHVSAFGNTGTMKSLDIHSLQEGIYLWSVQSLDAAYHGSTFAPEQTFEIVCGEAVNYDFYDTAHSVYEWEGNYYFASGIYSKIFESSTGCDSIVRLHLTIDSLERGIVYVTQNGAGNKSGYSWDNAMDDLQQALLTSANRNAVVWVAEGTYTNERGESAAFVIPETADIFVYGGFSGTEPADYDLNLRNFKDHETILDGLNRMNVLLKGGGVNNTIVDGFTIQHGYGEYGGGVFVNSWGNCPFLVKNCCIKNNTSSVYGGGYCGSLSDSNPLAIAMNCLILNNRAWQEGAVSSITLINSTVVSNTADYDNGFGHAECYNSIIWGNVPSDGTYYTSSAYSSAIQFELIGNIDDNCFYLNANNDGEDTNAHYVRFMNPENGDYRLSCGSSCINMGMSDIGGLNLSAVDLQGNPRVMDGRIDIGAYEFDTSFNVYYTITALPNTDLGGTVANSDVYTYGQICHLYASANEGYNFLYWLENGEIISDDLEYSFMVSSDRNISAVFVEEGTVCGITFELSGWYPTNELVVHFPDGTSENISTEFGQTTTATFTRYVNDGTLLSLNFIPSISSWECELSIYDANGNVIHHASNLDENFHYDYIYHCDGSISYIVKTSVNPEEGGTVTGAESYTPGETANLTAIPNEGFSFVNWMRNGEIVSTDSTLSFSVTESGEYMANFCSNNIETLFDTACEQYTWNDYTYTESGDYTQTFTNVDGCDSVVTLHLTIKHATATDEYLTICENELPYHYINGQIDTTLQIGTPELLSNNFYLLTESGCDSVVTLHITVNSTYATDEYLTICDNELPYHYTNGQIDTIFNIGTPELLSINFYLLTESGCDSVVTLHLTITNTDYTDFTDEACEGYTWNSETYTQSGDYTQTFTNLAGCDSVVTLHLTVNYPAHTAITETACESFTWNGTTYTVSGDYTYSHADANGCTQVDTLHLTINYPVHTAVTENACETFTWNGTTYTVSGDYTYSHADANGCTQVDTLHLTINNPVHTAVSETACESFTWNGTTYTVSGDYEQTFTAANGCDSIVTLHLTINQPTTGTDVQTACDSYTWIDGVTYSESNNTAIYTLTNAAGCDSVVTLNLTINSAYHTDLHVSVCDMYEWNDSVYTQSGNYTQTFTAANGCDSMVTLHLTLKYAETAEYAETACDSYTWNDSVYIQSGDYVQTFTNAVGCDSVVTLHLTINQPTTGTDVQTACGSFIWIDGITYTESNSTATYTLTNAAGCDSVITLNLTVNYGTHNVETETVCESFTWHGVTYTTSDTYTYEYTNASGCASMDTLYLTVNHGTHNVETETACDSFTWHDIEYTASGTYTYEYTNTSGCASVDTLYLTVNHGTHNVETETACESFTWHGVTYTTSDTYTYEYTNASGCASVDTLYLTVNHGTHNVETETACESFMWHGVTYTTSGTYTYEYTNTSGCASVDTLHLTVNHGTHNVETETACESFTWHGIEYTASGTYTYEYTNANGCTSVDTLHLTINHAVSSDFAIETSDSCYSWNENLYCESGDYTQTLTAANGCDSVVTLHLTITVGIDDHDLSASMMVYPNPTNGIVNVQCTMNNVQVGAMEYHVFDAFGRLLRITDGVKTGHAPSLQTDEHDSFVQTAQIDLSGFTDGVYFVKAVADGNVVAVRKVVKR